MLSGAHPALFSGIKRHHLPAIRGGVTAGRERRVITGRIQPEAGQQRPERGAGEQGSKPQDDTRADAARDGEQDG
jgi:hypothetical protein